MKLSFTRRVPAAAIRALLLAVCATALPACLAPEVGKVDGDDEVIAYGEPPSASIDGGAPGHAGVTLVSAGQFGTSPAYKMGWTVGEPPTTGPRAASTSYYLRDGVIGATAGKP